MAKKSISMPRIIALLTALIMLCSCVFVQGLVLASESSENFESGTVGTFVCDKSGGVTIRESSGNHYMNISPAKDGLSASASFPVSLPQKSRAEVSFSFMLNDYVIDGQTIVKMSLGPNAGITVVTHSGGLYYKNGVGGYIEILKELLPNKWYSVGITADYNAGAFCLSINQRELVYNGNIVGKLSGVDNISFSAMHSPGFAVDDFSVNAANTAKTIVFEGEKTVEIPENTSGETSVEIRVEDRNGTQISGAECSLTLTPENSGVSFSQSKDCVNIKIDAQAPAREYTLRAAYGGVSEYFRFNLKRYAPTVKEIKIDGEARIAYLGEEKTYAYKATAYDDKGYALEEDNFTYFLSGVNFGEGVSINSQTGELTVSAPLPKDTKIEISAEISGNLSVVGTKTVLLQDEETYHADNNRFQILLDYVDRVRELGRDPWNGTPLLAMAIDRYTMKPAAWRADNKTYVPTNLANQGSWFRMMNALYTMTGDEQYKKEVTDTYQFYIDNLKTENGFFPWGGHAYVDLRDLSVVGEEIMEFKSSFPYMEPYFELDPEGARRHIISLFRGSFVSWSGFILSRHTSPSTTFSTREWDDWRNLAAPIAKGDYGLRWVQTGEHAFRYTATDLVYMMADLYARTGEEQAFKWAYRILQQYFACADQETKLPVFSFTSRKGMITNIPGVQEDRVIMCLIDDLWEQGYVNEWQRDNICIDPYYIYTYDHMTANSFSDIRLAESVGIDTPEGYEILDYHLTGMANYVKYAYNEHNNTYSPILGDGTKLTGLVTTKNGYYTTKGGVLQDSPLPAGAWMSYVKTYAMCKKYEEQFGEQLYTIWQLIQNHARSKGLGEMGYARPGDGTKVDLSTNQTDPSYLVGLCMLYGETGEMQYLDLARKIADNIVKSNMVSGLFTHDTASHYISLGGAVGTYVYGFTMLEAALRGQLDEIPEFFPCSEAIDDAAYKENTNEFKDEANVFTIWYNEKKVPVRITSIDIGEEEITMKVGEEKYLEIAIEPDDATDRALNIVSSDPSCVSLDYENRCLYALKPGKTQITIVVTNKRWIKKTLTVNVVE